MESNIASDSSNETFKELPPDFIISKDKSHIIFNKEIEKSNNDDRSYRIIRLRNEVLIIHDAKSNKAAATLSVNVGSFSDPVSNHYLICLEYSKSREEINKTCNFLGGLAHYCEHLLFMVNIYLLFSCSTI